MATLVRSVTGTDPCHIIARLQGPNRIMNLHSDLDSRGYVANCAARWATDGSAGTVDFRHDANKLIVYRIHMTKPIIYLMDPRGGGLVATDPDMGPERWAHGVTTCGLEASHFLVALMLEYRCKGAANGEAGDALLAVSPLRLYPLYWLYHLYWLKLLPNLSRFC